MELKRKKNLYAAFRIILLIVPYGIETEESGKHVEKAELLIVPYGIETQQPPAATSSHQHF